MKKKTNKGKQFLKYKDECFSSKPFPNHLLNLVPRNQKKKEGKAKPRKSKDQSGHSNVKMPGIPEKEKRKIEKKLIEVCKKISQSLRTHFQIKRLTLKRENSKNF